jgi:hypothetical protein
MGGLAAMHRGTSRIVLRWLIVSSLFSVVLASSTVASASVRRLAGIHATGSQELWDPTQAPLPSVLPSGNPAESMDLEATSCSSTSFCVAVGFVIDTNGNFFPVAETFADGSWSAIVVPLPANAQHGSYWDGTLTSVSCPIDGVCAAVGTYLSTTSDPSTDAQNGLLENLSGDVWTPTEAPLPSGLGPYDASVDAVSCPDPTTCTAIGWAADDSTLALVFTWSSGSWVFEMLPVPADAEDYSNGLQLTSISCPDDDDCTAVGAYENSEDLSEGLILTLSDGIWGATTAPLPANATPAGPGAKILDSVDCPQSNYCVAGGSYHIPPMSSADGSGVEALLLVYQSGTWTPVQAPLPPDADVTDLQSFVQSVDCPAENACIAAGSYNLNYAIGEYGSEEGMLLTQAPDGSWGAAAAPLPESQESLRGRALHTAHASTRISSAAEIGRSLTYAGGVDPTGSSMNGVSCDNQGFCAAGGADNGSGLIESQQIPTLPSVDEISPSSGPMQGGTEVTVSGDNFTPDTTVAFGDSAATSATYVSATEIQAVAPEVSVAGPVDVNVTTDGVTSRATATDSFTFDGSGPAPSILSFSPSSAPVGNAVTITGANFSGATQVAFSWNLATITVDTSTQITATVPLGEDTGLITVTTPNGTATSGADFSLQGFDVLTTTLRPWTTTSKYDYQLQAIGGTHPYKWKKISGKMPKGMTLSSEGSLSGTSTEKTKVGHYTFTVEVTDATKRGHNKASKTFTLDVSA